MKYIAVLDSDDKLSEEAIKSIKNTVFCGDEQAPYFFDVDSVEEVTDQIHKKGKWINKSHTSGCGIKFVASECTCCGKKTFFDCDQLVYNYCPNCGAKMENE